jgi:hypothetical protein
VLPSRPLDGWTGWVRTSTEMRSRSSSSFSGTWSRSASTRNSQLAPESTPKVWDCVDMTRSTSPPHSNSATRKSFSSPGIGISVGQANVSGSESLASTNPIE